MPATAHAANHLPDLANRLLDAAEELIRDHGVTGLTLAAAARAAGVSKGGLLYHFATKEALLHGLMQRLAAAISAEFDALVAQQPPGRGRVAHAMLAWAFDRPEAVCDQHDRMAAVFLACFHQDPALLDPVRTVFARMRAAVASDGLPPGHGMAIMAAGDGLFMAHVFGLYALTPAEQPAVRAALAQLIGPGA